MLPGIRVAPKEDLGCCSAELVYGSTIRVPGDCFQASGTKCRASNLFLHLDKGLTKKSIAPDIVKATHVFIRHVTYCLQLQGLFNGPCKILTPGNKTLTMHVGNREDTISVDRLKPAHVYQDVPVQVAIPP